MIGYVSIVQLDRSIGLLTSPPPTMTTSLFLALAVGAMLLVDLMPLIVGVDSANSLGIKNNS